MDTATVVNIKLNEIEKRYIILKEVNSEITISIYSYLLLRMIL